MRKQIWEIGGSGYAHIQDKHRVKERSLQINEVHSDEIIDDDNLQVDSIDNYEEIPEESTIEVGELDT